MSASSHSPHAEQSETPSPLSTRGWDERALLLLGVLIDQSQHGYQINDFIERRVACVYPMKKPTAYALLDRLELAGAVAVRIEQAGNRPPRKVYTLTEGGRALFKALLEENLRSFDTPSSAGDIGLIFLDRLDPEAAIAALRQRLAGLDRVPHVPDDLPAVHAHEHLRLDLALDRAQRLQEAERAWLCETIARLEEEAEDAESLTAP